MTGAPPRTTIRRRGNEPSRQRPNVYQNGSHELAVHFNENKAVIEAALCGSEAERRKWELTPPPMSKADMDAARAKVQAENSARAKRAAATRAARKAASPPI
jgi:hypothetical protein